MKTITLLFVFICGFTFAQYPINKAKAPYNQAPKIYTLQHLNLKGAIQYYWDSFTFYEFDKKGRVLRSVSTLLDDSYQYDVNGKLVRLIGRTKGFGDVTYAYSHTAQGYITGSVTGSNTKGHSYLYNSQNQFHKQLNSKGELWNEYLYDNEGRVEKSIMYFPSSGHQATTTYTYIQEGNYLKVDINYTHTNPNTKSNQYTEYYYNGHYVGRNSGVVPQVDNYGNAIAKYDKYGNTSTRLGIVYFNGDKSGLDISDRIKNGGKAGTTPSTPAAPSTPMATNTPTTSKKRKTSGCIYGDCQNGFGKWQYSDGYYDGFWKNGQKHGYGLYLWNNKAKYQGMWANGRISGQGRFEHADDAKTLEIGPFENGKLNGRAAVSIIVDGKNQWTYGEYTNGELTKTYKFFTNNIQTGCIAGDCQNGYGRHKWSNGDTYTGYWANGKLQRGVYLFANGDQYSGSFNNNNQYNGYGRFFFKNGSFYTGQWQSGKYHGLGYLYIKEETKTNIGEFSNGSLTKRYSTTYNYE